MGKYPTHGWHLMVLFCVTYMVAVFGTGRYNEIILGASVGVLISWVAWALNYAVYKFKKWRDERHARSDS